MAQKKVAVTTFWVSKHIGFEQLGGNSVALAAAILSLSDDPNFNLQPVLDNFYNTFTKEYAEQFPFELMKEEDVIKTEAYQNYETRWGEGNDKDRNKLFQRYLTPEGYKPMMESLRNKGENSNTMQMIKMFPDADGIMFVTMGYNFIKKPVPFTAGVQAYIKIKLWNKEAKRVFVIHEFGTSKKSVGIVGGIPLMKPDKLLSCESASDKLVADLGKKIKKISKKAAKKLKPFRNIKSSQKPHKVMQVFFELELNKI